MPKISGYIEAIKVKDKNKETKMKIETINWYISV